MEETQARLLDIAKKEGRVIEKTDKYVIVEVPTGSPIIPFIHVTIDLEIWEKGGWKLWRDGKYHTMNL